MLLTSVGALGLTMVVQRWLEGSWPSVSEILTGGSSGSVPLAVLALGAGVSFAAAPHLYLPFRRFGRWCVWGAAGSTMMLGSTTPTGALLSLLHGDHRRVGGAPGARLPGRPTLARRGRGCVDPGGPRGHRPAGSRPDSPAACSPVEGAQASGEPILVKVYGSNARDTQLLSRMWRAIWYRGAAPVALTRQQQVEHEGFVTLLADQVRGVPVPTVVVAGGTK